MTPAKTRFGIAMRNFTRYPDMPDAQELIAYGVRMEELGFESIWAWDHIMHGVEPSFPIHEAMLMLTAIAARTSRIRVGTGALVLPMRNPVMAAKQLATLDHISGGRLIVGATVGWYKREFDSLGVDFHQRGRLMEQSLEIIDRLWREPKVEASLAPHHLRGAVFHPKPVQQPRPPILIAGYADPVLKRSATKGDGWMISSYTPQAFTQGWAKVQAYAREAGRDPATLTSANHLPICIGPRAEVADDMRAWLRDEWDYASWSEDSMAAAIIGSAEECAAQIRAHVATGVGRIIFVPYRFDRYQIEALAKTVLPLVG